MAVALDPPLLLIMAAFTVAAIGIILGALVILAGKPVPLALADWVMTGPTAVGVMAGFSNLDTRRRVNSVHWPPTWVSTAYRAGVACCTVGIGVGAWQIALWLNTLSPQ
jgi:hypothetical protein